MSRTLALVACVAVLSITSNVRAQINPAGFLDPAGANRAGTANPPNTTIGPIGGGSMYGSMYGSTLPPGAPGMTREVETNPALRQEVRRPFGGGGYRGAGRARLLPGEENGDGQKNKDINLSERQNVAPVKMAEGPATGKLAADWRYKYFQGRHWYWMPNNTWEVWHNAGWVPYKARMFSQPLFGYGTQVRGYHALPPNHQGGQPTVSPIESTFEASEPERIAEPIARAPADIDGEVVVHSPDAVEPSGVAEPNTSAGTSSAGPSMPNEHFISP